VFFLNILKKNPLKSLKTVENFLSRFTLVNLEVNFSSKLEFWWSFFSVLQLLPSTIFFVIFLTRALAPLEYFCSYAYDSSVMFTFFSPQNVGIKILVRVRWYLQGFSWNRWDIPRKNIRSYNHFDERWFEIWLVYWRSTYQAM